MSSIIYLLDFFFLSWETPQFLHILAVAFGLLLVSEEEDEEEEELYCKWAIIQLV